MNEIKIFENSEFGEIRTVLIDGEVWFVLKDICEAMKIKNATYVAQRLESDEVTRFNLGDLSGEVNIVNESVQYTSNYYH